MKPLAILTLLVGILAFQAVRPGRPPPGRSRPVAGGYDGRIDLNRATADELEGLPGVGPSRAAAILALRRDRGRLHRLEELLEVPGIGDKTLERLRPYVLLTE
jgi:competence protein ComEA